MKKITASFITLGLIFGLSMNTEVSAQTLDGRQIIEKVYNRPTPKNQTSTLTMTLINKSGETRVRTIKQNTKDFGDVEKNIMFFVTPADVKNTSFMNWTYADETKSDDQWIYLPALKKTKRISSESKSDYFMGSDFTYDDLGDRKLEDDVHKLLGEETIDGKDCYIVESASKNKDYMYSRTVTWVVKGHFMELKKEFYDEDGEKLKVQQIKKYGDFDGIYIKILEEMVNVQDNHSTSLFFENINISVNLPEDLFTERMLMRGI